MSNEAVCVRTIHTVYDVSCMASYTSRAEWERRAGELREHILACCGLLPTPKKTPLKARTFGRIDRGDYTVEKVYFESLPGFYCTGNLYRPKGEGPFPAVINPHGHWKTGRLANEETGSVPGRCISFARQGYVAFTYDMIGYNDSRQIKHDFGSDRTKLWAISLGGLQLLNSIRAIDFVGSLPDVDGARIACTGESGGGTQTYMVTAVDRRIRVCAPVVMVSAHMQGGCICENPPNLRIATNNVELAALAAPRPMLLVAATGDWTANTPTVEFPAIQSIYKLLGVGENVAYARFDAPHNYNRDSREAVYSWFGRWLPAAPLEQPVTEPPFEVEKDQDLLVFPDGKLPKGALDAGTIVRRIISDAKSRLKAAKPVDAAGLRRLRRTYLPLLRHALALPLEFEVHTDCLESTNRDGFRLTNLAFHYGPGRDDVPGLLYEPARRKPTEAVLVVHARGMAALTKGSPEQPGTLIRKLLDCGEAVVAIDVFGVGSRAPAKGAPPRSKDVSCFDTYNRTDAAERVCDIVTALHCLRHMSSAGLSLVGVGDAGLWCLLARPFAPKINALAADCAGFESASDAAFLKRLSIPCIRKAGDLATAVAACAPGRLMLHNTQGKFETAWARAAYAAAGATGALTRSVAKIADGAVAAWLVAPK